MGQSNLELWPRHAISIDYGLLMAASLKASDSFGQQHDFTGRAGSGSSVGIAYTWRFRSSLVLGASIHSTGIGKRFDLSFIDGSTRVAYNGINAPAIRPGLRWLLGETPEAVLHFGKELHTTARWKLAAFVIAGVIPRWSSLIIYNYRYAPVDPQRPIFQIITDEGLDIFPIAGFRLQLDLQAKNNNRWSLMLDGRATLANYYEGSYSLYPDTPIEGGGLLRGRLAYLRIGIGYALTWGAPRKPRWMRLQEQRGLPIP